jgi:hypothetical protein
MANHDTRNGLILADGVVTGLRWHRRDNVIGGLVCIIPEPTRSFVDAYAMKSMLNRSPVTIEPVQNSTTPLYHVLDWEKT